MNARDLLIDDLFTRWDTDADDGSEVVHEGITYDVDDDVQLEAAATVLADSTEEGDIPDALRRARQEGAAFLGEKWDAWIAAYTQRSDAPQLHYQGTYRDDLDFAGNAFYGAGEIPDGIVVDWPATAEGLLAHDYVKVEADSGHAYFRRT